VNNVEYLKQEIQTMSFADISSTCHAHFAD